MDTTPDTPAEETWEDIPEDVMALSTDEILTRIRLIENDIKVDIYCGGNCVISMLMGLVGDAVRNSEIAARAERHEREDS